MDLVSRHWTTAELSEYRVTLVPVQWCPHIASATTMDRSSFAAMLVADHESGH